MPNPSNSDLVGEAPDDLTHYMQKCSELAQQLDQAEQREKELGEFVTAHTLVDKGVVDFELHAETVERFRQASEAEHVVPIIRAALTTTDSATEQERWKEPLQHRRDGRT